MSEIKQNTSAQTPSTSAPNIEPKTATAAAPVLRGERPARTERPAFNRGPRTDGTRPFTPRPPRDPNAPFTPRPPRDPNAPFVPRTGASGDRPARSFGDRPARSFGPGSNNPNGTRPAFGDKNRSSFGNRRTDRKNPKGGSDVQELESKVIEVRRVTRVVKGGKRMRFSALVVVGDRQGKVGYGLKKGQDFQDAVAKATKQANGKLIKVSLDANKSLAFTSNTKHKSSEIFLKTASHGVGLIAGGFIRPVLELAGIENIYSKINRSRNKIAGVQCVIAALSKYTNK
jgi:small subunit ribosomal protein S5